MKRDVLSARKVASLKDRGFYCDGGGLYLQISKGGTKSWVFRFALHGRTRDMGLGSIETFSLAEARELAHTARQSVAQGIDPIDERQGKRDAAMAEHAKRVTFRDVAERYLAEHSDKWSNDIHRRQWRNTLQQYAFPILGNLPVDAIQVEHITKLIDPIWKRRQVTAKRVLGRIENVLAYATVKRWRSGDNPARWKGHLDTVFARNHSVRRHAALPVTETPAFMATLRNRDRIQARALEFTILTATRESETRLAVWSEFDLTAQTWTIPAERMKGRREHTVPLSKRAIEILHSLPRNGARVFKIHRTTMTDELELMGLKGRATVHGFRSTFRDWAGDLTSFDRETIEHALAHKLPDAAEAAYRLNKRRLLMEAWSGYCAGETVEANIVSMHGAA
jgi:integrase